MLAGASDGASDGVARLCIEVSIAGGTGSSRQSVPTVDRLRSLALLRDDRQIAPQKLWLGKL